MELLFDDLWVDRKAGVRRVLGVPRKEPEPILTPENPLERSAGDIFVVLFDEQEKKFKCWYRTLEPGARPRMNWGLEAEQPEEKNAQRRMLLCYAESPDGRKWVKPDLGLFELNGNRRNNVIKQISERDSIFYNIMKDPTDPDPSRRYKAIGFDDGVTVSVSGVKPGTPGACVGYSPDGFRWTEPKLVMSTADLTDSVRLLCRREPTTGKYVAFMRPRTSPKRRYIAWSESDDFDHWVYPRMLITPDSGDDEWSEFYGMTIAVVDRWRVGLMWVYHNNPDYSPVTNELVYSRDGLHYFRAMPNETFLPLGPEGSVESRMLWPANLLKLGSDMLLFYGATNCEHGADRGLPGMQAGRVAPGEQPRMGLMLATIPGLNFCGLRAEIDGLVETKWICNYGQGGAQAYAEIDKDGWIRAEILDQYGNVIPGWDRSLSRVRQAEDGCLHFSWGRDELVGAYNQVSEAKGTIGHVVKLRFHLHKATLYGFQIGEDKAMPPYVA